MNTVEMVVILEVIYRINSMAIAIEILMHSSQTREKQSKNSYGSTKVQINPISTWAYELNRQF
jgi:hypothetical protein